MKSEFIALDKAGEEAEWLRHFLEDIPIIAIVNQQLEEHGVIYITVSLDIFVEDTIP